MNTATRSPSLQCLKSSRADSERAQIARRNESHKLLAERRLLAQQLAAQLTEKLADYGLPAVRRSESTWHYAGTADHVIELLRQALEAL